MTERPFFGGKDHTAHARPVGVTAVALANIVVGMFALVGVFVAPSETSVWMGLHLPLTVGVFFTLVWAGVLVYCAVGLLNMKRIAYSLYIWTSILGMANYAIGRVVIFFTEGRGTFASAEADFYNQIVGPLVALLFWALLLVYISKRRNSFVN
jgi:hypothetical protein